MIENFQVPRGESAGPVPKMEQYKVPSTTGHVPPESKEYIDSLAGLRAIAAGIVVLHHLVPVKGKGWGNSLLEELNVGVTIFFVLSGFLICYRYFGKNTREFKWYYNYAVNRVARIYPMYFLLTTFTITLAALGQHTLGWGTLREYILNITFLRGFFSTYVYSGISQGWTLTVEECFYFSAPIMFILSHRLPIWVQSILIFLLGCILWLCFRKTDLYGFMNNFAFIHITTFFGRVFEFAVGIMMAFRIMKGGKIKHATLIGGVGFLVGLLWQVAINHVTHTFAITSTTGYLLNETLLPVSVALFIYGIIKEDSVVKRFLQTKLMVILGKSSYTLYLLHWGMTSYLIHRFISSNFIVDILLTYLLSVLLWHFIEEPANKLVKTLKK